MIRRFLSFGLALMAPGLAIIPWVIFGHRIEPSPYPLLLVAVVVVARYLGLWEALLSTAFGALLTVLDYQASLFSSLDTWLQFAIFVVLALFVSQIVAASDRATRQFRSAHAEAEAARQAL